MCVCVCVCGVFVRMTLHACVYDACKCVHAYSCIWIYAFYVGMSTCKSLHVCVSVCMHVCMMLVCVNMHAVVYGDILFMLACLHARVCVCVYQFVCMCA